jgi:hypothetical protein
MNGLNQWLVSFNPNKTEVMFFTSNTNPKPILFFNNNRLDFVDHHKHLGLTISHDLKWQEHIEKIM